MFARLFIMVLGLACACAAALLFLPVALVVDPMLQQAAGQMPAERWLDVLVHILSEEDPEEAAATLFHLVWSIGMLICVLPVVIIGLVGAVSGTHAFAFYAGGTGLLAAAMPWVLRAGRMAERGAQISAAETHLTIIFFLTGALAGTIYWLIAARERPDQTGRGWMAAQPRG